jgi:Mg2+/Co2+ transporter CorC
VISIKFPIIESSSSQFVVESLNNNLLIDILKRRDVLSLHKENRERNDLVDIWRIFNPSEKRYS